MPFGGMLGSTFNFVFESQLENLQDGDRFYYLSRTQGLNLLNELENNSFAKLIMGNTDLRCPDPTGTWHEDDIGNCHAGVDIFAEHDFVLRGRPAKQRSSADPGHDHPALDAISAHARCMRDDPRHRRRRTPTTCVQVTSTSSSAAPRATT